MLELLNTKIFDNERNILNADLFVNNFNPQMPIEQFDKFRLFFINSLKGYDI